MQHKYKTLTLKKPLVVSWLRPFPGNNKDTIKNQKKNQPEEAFPVAPKVIQQLLSVRFEIKNFKELLTSTQDNARKPFF